MLERLILSDSDWTLKQLTKREFFSKAKIDYLSIDGRESIPASVPGNVRLDLLNAGKIADPFFGKNNEKSKWVNDAHWAYEKTFEIPISFKNKDIYLRFKRTDYIARFFLNGHYLGHNIGSFSSSIFNVSKYLEYDKELQVITVFLKGAPRLRNWALKCQMSYGWDFAPDIRTIGIWDDVELFHIDGGRLRNYFIHYAVQEINDNRGNNVDLFIELDIDIFRELKEISLEITIPELNLINISKQKIKQGKNHLIITLPIPEVELWYPNMAGEQKQYSFNLTMKDPNKDVVMDMIESIKIGFRSIRLAYNPRTPKGNEKWTFIINNRPEFIRGANWVPLDSILGRIDEKNYSDLILLAKKVNINMFRMWGGGILEKESFYELCDSHGILIWQEFPFACSNYPNDKSYLKLLEKECRSYINQIRNHASVAIYVGGNEWNPRFNSHIIKKMKKCQTELDPARVFYDVSPCKGDLHDWSVWHVLQDFDAYKVGHKKKIENYQFFSEFGLQSCPSLETFNKMMPKSKHWPISDHWKYHNAQRFKLERYGRAVCDMKDLKSYIHATQVAQAEGLKVGIEYVRRMKPKMSGVLFWQWNEPWPTICWSVIDHFGTPKIAYNYLKQAYNPILPILEYQISKNRDLIEFDIHAINDFHEDYNSCELEVDLLLKGDIIKNHVKSFNLIKESSLKLNEKPIKFPIDDGLSVPSKANLNLKAKILDERGNILSQNDYFPFRYREYLKTPMLHEILTWLTDAFNEKFFWIYEIRKYLKRN